MQIHLSQQIHGAKIFSSVKRQQVLTIKFFNFPMLLILPDQFREFEPTPPTFKQMTGQS